jgi:hypothetical protein
MRADVGRFSQPNVAALGCKRHREHANAASMRRTAIGSFNGAFGGADRVSAYPSSSTDVFGFLLLRSFVGG